MFKKVTKRTLALFTCLMTIMQSIVPTYALENLETTPVPVSASTLSVSVQGSGNVVVTSNGAVTNVTAGSPFSQSYPEGTNVSIEAIGNQENVVKSFTNNGISVPTFVAEQSTLRVDHVTTPESANFVVTFKEVVVSQEQEVEQKVDTEPIEEPQEEEKKEGSSEEEQNDEPKEEASTEEEKDNSDTEKQDEEESIKSETLNIDFSNQVLTSQEQAMVNDYRNGIDRDEYVAIRKKKAEMSGLWKYCDEKYFLTDAYYSIYDVNMLQFDGLNILNKYLLPSVLQGEVSKSYPNNTFTVRSTRSLSVTEKATHTLYNGAGTLFNGIWRLSNGHLSFCAQGLMAPPEPGDITGSPQETDNASLRKALYYGYGGPGDCLTGRFGVSGAIVITDDLVSMAYSGQSIGHDAVANGYHWNTLIGGLWNEITSKPDPTGFTAYIIPVPGQGYNYAGQLVNKQCLTYGMYNPTGSLQISKKSANPEITDNNPCYGTMEGAEYGLYTDVSATNKINTFTIGSDGKSNKIDGLDAGTYYVKEIKAPKGYALDKTVYSVQVNSGELTTKEFVDYPQSDPISVLLGKVDKETNANKPQGSASLENAEFTVKFYGGLYDTDPAKDGKKAIRTWVLKTDEQGRCRLDKNYKISGDEFWTNSFGVATLPIGTLTIQETKVPKGYKLNDEVFVRKITADGNSESVQTYNQPTIPEPVMLGDFSIRKVITSGNASEIVRPEVGAEFTAIYKGYIDQYGSFEEALKHIDEFQTNEHSKLVTNEQGIGTSGKLAYGTYVVKQTKATEETDILKESFEVTISKDGQHFEYTINNRPSTYYVKIVKKDADTGKIVTLNNASFQIVKHRKDGSIDANYSDKGQIRTDANGIVSVKNGLLWYNSFVTNADNRLSFVDQLGNYEGTTSEDKGSVTVPLQLPAGDYELQEINAPDGYLKGQSVKFSLKKDLVTETDPDGDAVLTVEYKDPKPKGRIELTKQFEDPDYIMHGKVTFDLVVVKDIVDPADGTVLYKANDVYGTYELNKDNNKIVIENLPMGVGESHFKLVEKTTYENYVLNTQEYPVDFVQTDMGIPTYTHEVTVENKLIKIRTQALNADTKDNQFNSAKQITVTDVVSYEGLLAGQEYTMHGVLMDKETGEPVKNADGTIVEGYKKFTPEAVNGTVDVKMTLDASQLGGKDFVVFESVLNTGVEGHETCEIARHHDLTDKNQTITILDSKIGTTAKSENGSHEQQVKDGKVTFIDTVAYENLVAGMNYKVSGVLMDKETGEPVKNADGTIVEGYKKFTPEAVNGTVDVTFEFDASAITSDTALVVFERLVEVHTDKEGVVEEIDVAQHEDIDDEGQTIHFIDIKTTAQSDNGTNEQQPVDKEITFTDTVHYEGLQVGKEYTVKGVLMNKETNEPLLDADGNQITGETTFTPEEANGTVDVVFTLNAKDLVVGQDIVVFEDLIRDEIKIASHADINDKDQTIHIIDVKTKASSEKDNHVGLAGKKVTITDTVSYTNLEVGKEYTVKGVLMNKETNEPLLDADGNQITGEATFTPEEANGTVDVIFTLDSSLLAGKEVVVFEDLYKEDIKVGSHADINDKDQTIKFKNYEIKVNKVDSLTKKNIISNKFEFTMFSDKECEEEVLTVAGNTEDGTAVFEVKEGTWYIKETKAPQGYKLSKEVVKVEVKDDKLYVNDKEVETDENYLYSIVYQNALLPSLQTGSQNHGGMYFMMMFLSGLAFAVYFMIRKHYLQ